jgi:hypothetical protein
MSDQGDVDETTKSTKTRAWWLSTIVTLLILPLPPLTLGYLVALDRAVPWVLWFVAGLEVLTATAWLYGAGAFRAARDALAGLQGG